MGVGEVDDTVACAAGPGEKFRYDVHVGGYVLCVVLLGVGLHSINENVDACVGECSMSLYVHRVGGTGGVSVVAEVGVATC